MLYVYAVIKGEKALKAYCQKRWQETPRFCESFAHIRKGKDDCTIEKICEQSPNGNGYEAELEIVKERIQREIKKEQQTTENNE